MRQLIFLFFLLVTTASSGQTVDQRYGTPVVVLTEINPWLKVLGSDVPSFVLYEKGQVIYQRLENGKASQYFEANLSSEEAKRIVSSLGITDSLLALPDFIEATTKGNQPTNELMINTKGTKIISVYGNLRTDAKARKATPKAFLSVYNKVTQYRNAKAKEWQPSIVEVLLTNYNHSPVMPVRWPAQWPGLQSPVVVKRSEQLYSLFLDEKHLNTLNRLISGLKPKQGVEIDGKKFSVAYRLPLPNLD